MSERIYTPENGVIKIYKFFTEGTERTVTGGKIGLEIETDFINESWGPITEDQSRAILNPADSVQPNCSLKLELGRQKTELNVNPQTSSDQLFEVASQSLSWLYDRARAVGAYPYPTPDFESGEDLLWVQEDRDRIWVEMDGRSALEELCRCSSIQFTVEVNPEDAIPLINSLWEQNCQINYSTNDERWRRYIALSRANYRTDRYAGPKKFENIQDYVLKLTKNNIVMRDGQPCDISVDMVTNLNVDLYLRSVWWNYRLRRYGDSLALEMRPFGRCKDEEISKLWDEIQSKTGLNV